MVDNGWISVGATPETGVHITKDQLDSIRPVTVDDNGVYRESSGELKMSTERDQRSHYYTITGAPPALWGHDVYRRSFKGRNLKTVQPVNYGTGSGHLYYSNVTKD
jgi:hypothetical protein